MKAAFALVVVGLAGVAAAQPKPKTGLVERSRLEVAPGGRPIKQLTIENPLGDIKVEGYDGQSILIETTKTAPDEEALDRLRVSLIPNPDGTVRILTAADGGKEIKPLSRGAVKIDLVIRAPRDARIDAAVSAGSLTVVNMDAGGDLDTGSGPISVRNVAGAVSTSAVSGTTSLTQVFGSVEAQSLASDVELDTIGGERLVASANKGKIAGRRVRARDVELTTTDGKISLEAESSLRGRMVVASLRGDIDVKLRRHGVVIVRARGAKLSLGSSMASAKARSDGWVEGQLGGFKPSTQAAIIELRSRYGMVQFAVIE
ncbi:MAG: DUF4097 family beta strand repeat protein [Deltaproteobacteria bacterium]|nr:DUF4097 family beta strand repeat protein [Deltaproteobacteria bacterium]